MSFLNMHEMIVQRIFYHIQKSLSSASSPLPTNQEQWSSSVPAYQVINFSCFYIHCNETKFSLEKWFWITDFFFSFTWMNDSYGLWLGVKYSISLVLRHLLCFWNGDGPFQGEDLVFHESSNEYSTMSLKTSFHSLFGRMYF